MTGWEAVLTIAGLALITLLTRSFFSLAAVMSGGAGTSSELIPLLDRRRRLKV